MTIDFGEDYVEYTTADGKRSRQRCPEIQHVASDITFRVVCTGDGAVEGGGIVRKIGSGGDVGQSATKVKISGASTTDVVSVEVSCDGTNDSFTIVEATLLVESSG